MKCVIGIDLERRSASVVALLGRLKFAIDETTLLHVTEPMQLSLPYSAYGMFTETDEIHETLRVAGEAALKEAAQGAQEFGLRPVTKLCDGYPTQSLTDFAEQSGAELIAVTSTVRNSIGAVFGGSVARGLAIGAKQSVLVARPDMPTDGALRAVFAIDQSPYCIECIKHLVAMAPKGISHLTLLTVYDKTKHESMLALMRGVDTKTAVDDASQRLTDKGEELAKWLTEQGIVTASIVIAGHVEETIHNYMTESKADLLIVGSQGHGFMDRMIVGSTSLHQVIGERYPVLVLRAVAPS